MLGDNHFARDNGPLSDRCPLSDPRPFPYDSALNATILIDHSLFKQYRFPHHRTTLHLDLRRKNRVRSHFAPLANTPPPTTVDRRSITKPGGHKCPPPFHQSLVHPKE